MTRIHYLFTFATIVLLACSAKVELGGNSPIPDSGSDGTYEADTATNPTDPRCEGFVPQTNHNRPMWCLSGLDRLCLQHCAVDNCSNECDAYLNHYLRSPYDSCQYHVADGRTTDDCDALYPAVVSAIEAFDTCVLCSCDDQCPLTNRERCDIPNLPDPCFECVPEHCVNMCETFDKLPKAFDYKQCIRFCANSESCVMPCAMKFPAEHASYSQYLDCALESCGTTCRRSDSCPINLRGVDGCSECLDTYCETECIEAVDNHYVRCADDTFALMYGMLDECRELFPNAQEVAERFASCQHTHCQICSIYID